jgi:gamma-glutamyltranspeptidase/glutathione hydrolase
MSLDHRKRYASARSPVFARNIVATSQPLAVQAGIAMMAKGGNAVDAALAAAITLTVVEPTGNGIGSDAFAIVWDGQELHGLNASGRAPAAWAPERFSGHDAMPQRGWDSVTVPGAVSAWQALSKRFGKLPFTELFGPAIRYARYGFPVSPIIAGLWEIGAKLLKDHPGYAEAFMPDGRAPKTGEMVFNRAAADTLEEIAATGGESFYRGALAARIAAFSAEHGGAMTEADLAAHQADWCGTISQRFGNCALHEIPPNGQGIASLMALGMLAHCRLDRYDPEDPRALHLQIEAMKLAFADARAYVADPAAMKRVRAEDLLAEDYLAGRARLIDEDRARLYDAGKPDRGGTVYLATADQDGIMVSYIQSNYLGFGSGVVVPGTGISLQNRGAGFSLQPGHPNEVGGGKRPYQTIIPGFVTDSRGAPLMSFGVMGGPMQPQGHLQMVLRTQLWGQDVQIAADAPRWQVLGGLEVAAEATIGVEAIEALRAMGHSMIADEPDPVNFGFGGAQLIARSGDAYIAGSDPRKDGCAIGF